MFLIWMYFFWCFEIFFFFLKFMKLLLNFYFLSSSSFSFGLEFGLLLVWIFSFLFGILVENKIVLVLFGMFYLGSLSGSFMLFLSGFFYLCIFLLFFIFFS